MRDKVSQNYYTYTLAYPDLTIFYVGKGKGNRIDHHEAEARKGVKSYKCNVIRQIWRDGGEVVKTKVCENMTEEAAFELEIDLIRMYGREHLTNMADGGEGGARIGAGRRPQLFHIGKDAARALRNITGHKRMWQPDLTEQQVLEALIEDAWREIDEQYQENAEKAPL